MPKGVPGSGGNGRLQVEIPRHIKKALRAYCLVGERDISGTASLALQRFLEATKEPYILKILREGEGVEGLD